MNKLEIVKQFESLNKRPYIEKIVDMSDRLFKRIRIYFKNGYELSVVYGYGAYANVDKLEFEIACIHEDSMTGVMWDDEDESDDFLGFVPEKKINYYIEKIGTAKPQLKRLTNERNKR